MSVVVQMKMPENCFECPFSIIDDTADGAWCNALANQVYGYAERDEDCPVICSLPEGHGRLVDADALFDSITKFYEKYGPNLGLMDMRVIFNNSPTIVPAEAESPSPKPTDPVPIHDVYYVMTECDVKTGTVTYEPRERIEL